MNRRRWKEIGKKKETTKKNPQKKKEKKKKALMEQFYYLGEKGHEVKRCTLLLVLDVRGFVFFVGLGLLFFSTKNFDAAGCK